MPVRTLIIGCVEFSQHMFNVAKSIEDIEIVAVVTRSNSSFNSDFFSLENDARETGIPTLLVEGKEDDKILKFIQEHDVEFGLCVGWSYLLPNSILESVKHGIIGYHPAALPHNRGRHPIIWALALGLTETASTFFKMVAKADEGAIIDQAPIQISNDDDAGSLYGKMITSAKSQLAHFVPEYLSGNLIATPQDKDSGNHWRKRSAIDGRIDWRMDYDAIRNLVRALVKPYPGASVRYGDKDICVWKVTKGPDAPHNIEPGKVLDVVDRKVTIKCWAGSVILDSHEFETIPSVGEYL